MHIKGMGPQKIRLLSRWPQGSNTVVQDSLITEDTWQVIPNIDAQLDFMNMISWAPIFN